GLQGRRVGPWALPGAQGGPARGTRRAPRRPESAPGYPARGPGVAGPAPPGPRPAADGAPGCRAPRRAPAGQVGHARGRPGPGRPPSTRDPRGVGAVTDKGKGTLQLAAADGTPPNPLDFRKDGWDKLKTWIGWAAFSLSVAAGVGYQFATVDAALASTRADVQRLERKLIGFDARLEKQDEITRRLERVAVRVETILDRPPAATFDRSYP